MTGGGVDEFRFERFEENNYSRQLEVGIYSQYDSGIRAIGRQQRGREYISPLSQGKIMKNPGLVCDRGSKLAQIDNIFISQNIIDFHLVGSGSYIFPLYFKSKGV